jgi:hypothetical protein
MIRRRKLLEICAESPASGARFVGHFTERKTRLPTGAFIQMCTIAICR